MSSTKTEDGAEISNISTEGDLVTPDVDLTAKRAAETDVSWNDEVALRLQTKANEAYANMDKEMGDRLAALAEVHKERAESLKESSGEEDSPWGTINPKDFTQESISAFENNFRKSGKWDRSILKPRDKGPDTKVDVTVNTGDGFWTKVGEGAGKKLIERTDEAEGHIHSINTIHGARRMLDQGAFTGFGSKVYLGFGRVLKAVGFDAASDPVANTEAYAAYTGNLVGQIIKQFGSGTGLSDADREYAQKIAAGDISLTEPALRKLLDLNEKASRIWLSRYKTQAAKVDKQANIPFKFDVPMPPAYERTETPADRVKRLEEEFGVDY